MKPLLSKKVKRGVVLHEWEDSQHQATVDGLNAFAMRQQARIQAAQSKPVSNVAEIRTRK